MTALHPYALPASQKPHTLLMSNYRFRLNDLLTPDLRRGAMNARMPSDMILSTCIIFTNLTHDLNDSVIQSAENSRAPKLSKNTTLPMLWPGMRHK